MTKSRKMMITIPLLNELTHIRHGFFTRKGGISTGIYTSLNCCFSSHDNPRYVVYNRARAMIMLGLHPNALITMQQKHTATVIVIKKPWACTNLPLADALVTKIPGVALGVLSADCAPVLLADIQAGVIGAAHAGWRGALSGIITTVVRAMQEMGATSSGIVAVVGPCITQQFYEVSTEFLVQFLVVDPDNTVFFVPSWRAGHYLFDLPSYITQQFTKLDVLSVVQASCNPLYEDGLFFSRRRSLLNNELDYGRGLSAIALK